MVGLGHKNKSDNTKYNEKQRYLSTWAGNASIWFLDTGEISELLIYLKEWAIILVIIYMHNN